MALQSNYYPVPIVAGTTAGTYAAGDDPRLSDERTPPDDVVTNAKLANVATATIKGRATAGTGDPEDLSAGQVRTILNVADGAEVNVQSNWTEADSGSDAFILNKPSIPTASSATPQALGVAAAGTSTDFARADHVHAMPSAADVGAAPALVIRANLALTADTTLLAGRNIQQQITSYEATNLVVTLPTSDNETSDEFTIIGRAYAAGDILIRKQNWVGSGVGPQFTTLATVTTGLESYIFRYTINGWELLPSNADWNASAGSTSIQNKPSIPTASSTTPQALGVAAAGTSVDFARADHVHAMPSAADVGAAPASGIDPTAISGTAVVDSDARLSDSRTPSSHSSSHASAGSDPLAPSDIGAMPQFAATDQTLTAASTTLTAGRARRINLSTTSSSDTEAVLPTTSNQDGDLFQLIRSSNIANGKILVTTSAGGSTLADLGTTDNAGRSFTFRYRVGPNNWEIVPVDAHSADKVTSGTLDIARIPTGTSSSTVCIGDDARLSDARTPTSHTHGNITNGGLVGTTANLPLKTGTGGIVETGVFGTGAGEFAEGNHTHTQLHDKSHTMTDATSHTAGNHKVFYSDGSGNVQELALGNSGEVLTSNGASAAPSFAAASGGIGGGTGSVDNALLRADGTGGSTSQSSDIVIDDATTSTQANVALVNNHSQTNSALVLTPKGSGAFIVGPKPDGTATGGNARGASSVDLQLVRSNQFHVASGISAICMGQFSRATGDVSAAIGGQTNNSSGNQSGVFCGNANTSSGVYSFVAGGQRADADRESMHAHSGGRFSANGDAQRARFVLRCKTTTDSAVEMALNGSTTYLTIPSGKIIFCNIKVVGVKSDGSAVATYERQYAAKNVAGTSSEVFAPVTIGTDNAASTSLAVSTDDTGDYISIKPTGIASEIWRWVASVDAVEVGYGT